MPDVDPDQQLEFDLSDQAQEFSAEIHKAAREAENEEELRIKMSRVIEGVIESLDIDSSGTHERTILSGRPDSVYGDLVIEYKAPNRTDNWRNEVIYGRGTDDHGLVDYLLGLASEQAEGTEEQLAILNRTVGVGTNGYKVFFCRYKPESSLEVDSGESLDRQAVAEGISATKTFSIADGARRLLTFLRSLQRRPLTSDTLAESFGPEGEIARETVRLFYQLLQEGRENSPRVEMLYEEWNRVFGVVYGEELDQIRDDREEFGAVYGIEDPEVRPLLFSVHSYYAILMKVIVRELVAALADAPIREADFYAPDDDEFRRGLRELESGRAFQTAGLQDFFEEGFFAWYLDMWNGELADQLRVLVEELREFEAATPAIKRESVKDVLKDLYQRLVPRTIRHDLGEYFTPTWLAKYTIDQINFEAGGEMLDPACGSGTFLLEAIQKVRDGSEKEGQELLDEILRSVVGFDLNPISVIASRTNYLLALGDVAFEGAGQTRIPVYQADSVLTPSKYVDIRAQGEEAYEVPTRQETFRVPAIGQDAIEELLALMGSYVGMDAEVDEFMGAVEIEMDVDGKWNWLVEDLYRTLLELDRQDKNKVWPQLLRNRLAPEFVGEFDYVIGNPPWVDWANMSADYREITKDVWEQYQLFEFSGYDAQTVHDDICILMTYVSIDEYLRDGGELSFILPQGLFQSHQGGHGFRRFSIPQLTAGGETVYEPMEVEQVDDLSAFNPFDATNRTSVVKIKKGEPTTYPVSYQKWKPKSPIYQDDSLSEALEKVDISEMAAEPVDEDDLQSEWLCLKPKAVKALREVIGESPYQAREGVNTLGADGVYYVEILEDRGDTVLMQNLPHEGRKRSIRERGSICREVEKELVYPAVKGRNIHGWGYEVELHQLVPHKNERGPHNGIPEGEMRTNFRNGYEYFQQWEDILRDSRERNGKFYDPEKDPFYLFDNVGEYTFKPFKAVWQRKSGNITASVLEPEDAGLGETKALINYDTVMAVGTDTRLEAHYLCAVLNSSFVRLVTQGYTNVSSGLSSHVLDNVAIPAFERDNTLHQEIAEFSIRAHDESDEEERREIESKIDEATRCLWGVTEEQLEDVQISLAELNN